MHKFKNTLGIDIWCATLLKYDLLCHYLIDMATYSFHIFFGPSNTFQSTISSKRQLCRRRQATKRKQKCYLLYSERKEAAYSRFLYFLAHGLQSYQH